MDALRRDLRSAEDRVRRRVDQSESSEEEGLKKTRFCSGCGNERCRRDAVECRDLQKVDRISFLLESFSPAEEDQDAKLRDMEFFAQLLATVAQMNKNVAERDS